MTYPKPFMSLADLAAFTGLSEEYLLSVYRRKDNDFAGKLDPAKKNSKIFFDTEKFDQWRANGNIQPVKTDDSRKRIDGTMALVDGYVVLQDKFDEYISLI